MTDEKIEGVGTDPDPDAGLTAEEYFAKVEAETVSIEDADTDQPPPLATPTPSTIAREWFRPYIEGGVVVLHIGTLFVGKPVRFYDVGEYVSPLNENPVSACVIEFADGGSLVVHEGRHETDFIPLEPKQAQIFHNALTGVGVFCREIVRLAGASGVELDTATMLLTAALKMQLAALGKRG